MLLNAKLNDTAQIFVHTCERVRNNISTTGITTSPFENFYGENSKIIGLFSDFRSIGYVTKWDSFRKQMTDKKIQTIVVVYADNHTRDTYKLYNPETKRVMITRDIKWDDWKNTDPAETLNIFCEA